MVGIMDSLGRFINNNPQTVDMIGGFGQGMLANSTASDRTPSFAEAMSGGFQGANQARGQFTKRQMQETQVEAMRSKMEQDRQRRVALMEMLGLGQGAQGGPQGGLYGAAATGGPQQPSTRSMPLQNDVTFQPAGQSPVDNPGAWEQMLPGLMQMVEQRESRGQHVGGPGSVAGPNEITTSPAGAIGIMQIMPRTGPDAARMAGMDWDPELFRSPTPEGAEYNRILGGAYLDHLGQRYDADPVLASAAYNWGMGNVDDYIAKVGDPRKGEISHEEWVRQLPVKEARDYAAAIGLPMAQTGGQFAADTSMIDMGQMGGGGQQSAMNLMAQMGGGGQQGMQQPMGNPQVGQPQQGGGGPLAGMPNAELLRQILPQMDPQDAFNLLGRAAMQQNTPQEQPAAVREAMFMAGGDPQRAQQIMLEDRAAAAEGAPKQRDVKIGQYMTNLGMSQEDAIKAADGLMNMELNPNTGKIVLTDLTDPSNVKEITPQGPPREDTAPSVTAWDILEQGNPTGLTSGLAELSTNTIGQVTPAGQYSDIVEQRQYIKNMENGLLRAAAVNRRFSDTEIRRIRDMMNLDPSVAKDESSMRAGLRATVRYLGPVLASERNVANDPSMPEAVRRDAADTANAIERFIEQAGVPPEELASGSGTGVSPEAGGVPAAYRDQIDPALWESMTPEERALFTE